MTNFTPTSLPPFAGPTVAKPSRLALGLAAAIRVYQHLRAGHVSPCRFYPSCSAYAHEAVLTHGAVRGLALSTRRLLRCRPLGPRGVDLVPEPTKARTSA
jgi:uncharacterized protein